MNTNFAAGLGMFLLRAGLLLACFWAVYGFTGSNPRARVMLCRIVSVAVVLLPLLNFAPLPAIFSLPEFHRAPVVNAPAAAGPRVPDEVPIANTAGGSLPPVAEIPPAPESFAPPAPAPARAWKLPHRPLPATLAATWLAVACLLLACWSVALFMARRLGAAAQTPPEWVREAGARFCARLGIRGRVAFGVAGEVSSPLLIGPGPVILLPRRLVAEDSPADVRAALAHELVHVLRRDWHWSQWLHLVAILTWPLPLVWFLRRAHDAAGELVCDNVAASIVDGPESYAGSLARQSLHATGHPNPAAVPMLRKSGIRRRIDLLLSGAALPSLSWRATLGAVLLTLLGAGLLGGLHPARAGDEPPAKKTPPTRNADIQKELETMAGETSYFEIDDVIRERPGSSSWALPATDNAKYTSFITRFLSIPVNKAELIPLLKHGDPKVRTLAIAALVRLHDPTVLPFIADLLPDDALTFSRLGQMGQSGSYVPPMRHDVTVGENAQEVLFNWLSPAGYNGYQFIGSRREGQASRKEFDDYWSRHKGRDYCASWFAVRLSGDSNGGTPSDASKQAVRTALDKIPQTDRTWIAVWLEDYRAYSEQELVEMCGKLGPEALMSALKKEQFPIDDPDLQKDQYQFQKARDFILQNANALLRPQDSDDLIALCSGQNPDPQWLIAAARLQPAKAVEILRPAAGKFDDAYDQFRLLSALWELGGESQTPFIVDKFYDIVRASNDSSGDASGDEFIGWMIDMKKPPGRKLIAVILQDKRVDVLQAHGRIVMQIARAVNGWSRKPIVSDPELEEAQKGVPMKTDHPVAPDLPLRLALLHRMRDTAPQWND